ncbi:hypothetical protein BJ166DRAFT_366776 [Pestalotiopsis sp. NC0098]|nr:hypothetical protein BJ166DRAFT_366776 [Pestalotiopsis sp. NC0098]
MVVAQFLLLFSPVPSYYCETSHLHNEHRYLFALAVTLSNSSDLCCCSLRYMTRQESVYTASRWSNYSVASAVYTATPHRASQVRFLLESSIHMSISNRGFSLALPPAVVFPIRHHPLSWAL